MKVKRMGIKEILRRIWLFSANKTKSSESFNKQPTQLIVALNSSLRHIIVTQNTADRSGYNLISIIIIFSEFKVLNNGTMEFSFRFIRLDFQ